MRPHDPQDRNRQNYLAFKLPDGSAPVLEATVVLHSREHPDWQNMTIGIPLALLPPPRGEHRVVIHFSGADWKLYVDGEMLDNDFPFGYPHWSEKSAWSLDPAFVKEAALCIPGVKPTPKRTKPRGTSPRVQAEPEQWAYLKQHGHSGEFTRAAIRGMPAGSTYAVSEDGVAQFRKTGVLFHPCENPRVYINPDGRLRMMANYRSKGIWESKSVNGGWRCISPEFPPGGDCTCFFHWGRFDYIIGASPGSG